MLEHAAHSWRNPRLFHVVLTGGSRVAYQALLGKLCRRIRDTSDSECDYVSADELDADKGHHCHVMMVMSSLRNPRHFFTTANEDGKEEASLLRLVLREIQADHPDLKASVWAPQSQPTYYIEFNQSNNELLNEACEWMSYIFKARSKPPAGVGQRCEVYGSSRRSRRVPSAARRC